MGRFGEMLPNRKLKDEQGEGGIAKNYDPGGPLDLDKDVVYLAPPAQDDATDTDEGEQSSPEG